MKELCSEISIAMGLLKKLQVIARAELKIPRSSVRWGQLDLEAANALDTWSMAPALHPVTKASGVPQSADVEIAGDVDVMTSEVSGQVLWLLMARCRQLDLPEATERRR